MATLCYETFKILDRQEERKVLSVDEIRDLLGYSDFEIIPLMSGDRIIVSNGEIENDLASTLLNQTVYGPALILEPWEIGDEVCP